MTERIKRIRMQKGLTQEQFGELINCSAMQVSRLESGRATLSADQVKLLASALGIEVEWLASGVGPMTSKEATRDRRSIGERVYQLRRDQHWGLRSWGTPLTGPG